MERLVRQLAFDDGLMGAFRHKNAASAQPPPASDLSPDELTALDNYMHQQGLATAHFTGRTPDTYASGTPSSTSPVDPTKLAALTRQLAFDETLAKHAQLALPPVMDTLIERAPGSPGMKQLGLTAAQIAQLMTGYNVPRLSWGSPMSLWNAMSRRGLHYH